MVLSLEAPVTCAEVQAAYDELDEKHHLVGISLHFARGDGEPKAIFEPVEETATVR